jgi:hypothetical protein
VIRTGYGICTLAVGTWLCIIVRHYGILKFLKTLFPRRIWRPTIVGRYSSAKTTLIYGSRRFGKSRVIRAWQNAYFLHQQFPTLARYNTTLLDYAQ